MATAGSRHVMESYKEVNDRLPVIPEAMMEIGHTGMFVDHTCSNAHTHTHTDECQGGEWCMFLTPFRTSLGSQGKRGHAVWLLTATRICAEGMASCWLLLFHWWVYETKQNHPAWYTPSSPKEINPVLQGNAVYIPISPICSSKSIYMFMLKYTNVMLWPVAGDDDHFICLWYTVP